MTHSRPARSSINIYGFYLLPDSRWNLRSLLPSAGCTWRSLRPCDLKGSGEGAISTTPASRRIHFILGFVPPPGCLSGLCPGADGPTSPASWLSTSLDLYSTYLQPRGAPFSGWWPWLVHSGIWGLMGVRAVTHQPPRTVSGVCRERRIFWTLCLCGNRRGMVIRTQACNLFAGGQTEPSNSSLGPQLPALPALSGCEPQHPTSLAFLPSDRRTVQA